MRTPSTKQLDRLLRCRIKTAIQDGTGAEIKNLVDAFCALDKATGEAHRSEQAFTVRFEGDAEDYSL